jgi:hypothetical protein
MEAILKKLLVTLIIIGIPSVAVYAQVSQTAVPFLLIAPGARAAGMGETFVAVADDATATHWNPAGLGRYPLSPDWIELPVGQRQKIEKIALVKNDMPDNNYKQYDIWAIINGHLASWNGRTWRLGISKNIESASSIKSAVANHLGLETSKADPYVLKTIELNTGIKSERIDSLQEIITAVIPENYPNSREIQSGFSRLKTAWSELKLNASEFGKFEKMVKRIAADSLRTATQLDSIAYGFDAAIIADAAPKINLPYDLLINSKINCLESHDGMIYIGADSGFYRFDPKLNKWKSYNLTDSLPSLKITALEKMGKKSIVIGTDKGIVYFNGVRVKTYSPNQAAPTSTILRIVANSDQDIWAATDSDIYHFDGAIWKNYFTKDVAVGGDLSKIISQSYRAIARIDSASLWEQVTALNKSTGEVTVGQKIKLPFAPVLRGKVTSLASKNQNLWIGTERGIILFDGSSFYHFGYREYTTQNDMSLIDIAGEFLPNGEPDKIERLAEKIREFNGIPEDIVPSGKTVLVYANALGSSIYSVTAPSNKKAYVATAHGVIEYNDGVWSRYSRTESLRKPVHTMKSESGELWFVTTDRVCILARATGQVTFMHSNYLVQLANDLYYDYFAIVYPTKEWGTFGTGFTFLSYGQQDRTNEVGDVIGQFNSYDFAWTASYGTKLTDKVSAGISGRIILSHLADVGAGLEKGKGVGFSGAVDGGIIYDVDPKLTLASTITNIGPEIAYIDADQADPLPRKLALAFSYKLIESPFNKLIVVGEADKLLVDLGDDLKTEIKEIIPHIGAEYWYSNYFALRAGYVYDDIGQQKYITLGGSLQYNRMRADISYIPSSNEETNRLGNTVRLSLNVGF